MNILDTIIAQKRKEVTARKQQTTLAMLEESALFKREILSLKKFLTDPARTGIIAEFKRKSPSKGWINANADPAVVTGAYAAHGASGLSVLTDEQFFGGSATDLEKARMNEIPILRKDFMIDEYQLVEARAMGADVVLLIAANLSRQEVKDLAGVAKQLGLEVLLEIHNEEELNHICDAVDLVGVNNRNLKTFDVQIETSIGLSNLIPGDKIKISESGISNVGTIRSLREYGYQGFLIGESFMSASDPAVAFAAFVEQLKS